MSELELKGKAETGKGPVGLNGSTAGAGLRYYWGRLRNRRLNLRELEERRTRLASYPQVAYFDVTNACPLSCPLCPTGNRESTARKGMMTLETFKNIFDQVAPYLYELHLYNWGEPFLNRRLVDMVRHAKAVYNPKVVLSTTLAGVSFEQAEEVLNSGVDLISVSIDGATQEVYEKYRVGGRLDRILATLAHMAQIKKSRVLRRPGLLWQFIPMRHNEAEIETARRMAGDIGVAFRTHRVRLNVSSFDRKDLSEHAEENRKWLPGDKRYIRYSKAPERESSCKFLWDRVVFNWDGSVAPCCKIYDRKDAFADSVATDGFFEKVWNGPEYVMARGIFTGKEADEGFVCQRCVNHDGNI